MTALGLGGLGRRPITVSVFPDFHPAQQPNLREGQALSVDRGVEPNRESQIK